MEKLLAALEKKICFPLSCRKLFVKRKYILLILIRKEICSLNIKEVITMSLYFCKTIPHSSYLKPPLPRKWVALKSEDMRLYLIMILQYPYSVASIY